MFEKTEEASQTRRNALVCNASVQLDFFHQNLQKLAFSNVIHQFGVVPEASLFFTQRSAIR
jgi:hypothetical protein